MWICDATRNSSCRATENRVAIGSSGRLRDSQRIATRYDRCAHALFTAITLAATITFWLGQRVLTPRCGRRRASARRPDADVHIDG